MTPIAERPGYYASEDGLIYSAHGGRFRVLGGSLAGRGYRFVQFGANGPREYIHRLIAQTFLPVPAPDETVVRHLDGDMTNNAAVNLAWGTHKDNMADMKRHGRTCGGIKNPCARLTPALIREIRAASAGGAVGAALARTYGVSPMTISRAVRWETWK